MKKPLLPPAGDMPDWGSTASVGVAVGHWKWLIGMLILLALSVRGGSWAEETKRPEAPRLVVQRGHIAPVASLAFSPDGTLVATGSGAWETSDHTVKIWHAETGRLLHTLKGHTDPVEGLAFAVNGKTLVSGGNDGIRLWDVSTGEQVRVLSQSTELDQSSVFRFHFRFSPRGEHLAALMNHDAVLLWNLSSNHEPRQFSVAQRDIVDQGFSSNGRQLGIVLDDGTVRAYDVSTGEAVAAAPDQQWGRRFSPDGRLFAEFKPYGEKRGVRFIDTRTGRLSAEIVIPEPSGKGAGYGFNAVLSLAFSPDGAYVATGGGNVFYGKDPVDEISPSDEFAVRIWNVDSGKLLHTLMGHGRAIRDLRFSPDGRWLASGSDDFGLKLWDTETGRLLHSIRGHNTFATGLAFSPDGHKLAIGWGTLWARSGPTVLDLASGAVERYPRKHGGIVLTVAFSPDSSLLASGGLDGKVKLWNVRTGMPVATLEQHAESSHVNSVAFSPSGTQLASGSGRLSDFEPGCCRIKFWDITGGQEPQTLNGHGRAVRSVTFSPDGKLFASGSDDSTAKLWDASTGRELRTLGAHDGQVWSVVFSPDGKLLASASGDKAYLWQVSTGRRLRTLHHGEDLWHIAFSPDGKLLALADEVGTVKIWDIVSGKELHALAQDNWVQATAFSHDGAVLASVSKDNSIRFWNPVTGQLIGTLYSFIDGSWVVTDPAGRFDTTDLTSMPHLHWVLPDDPLTPLPLEIFMRDYYEPRLLPRILKGEKLQPVRDLSELNRVQPEVSITAIKPDSAHPDSVLVSVTALGASRAYQSGSEPITTAVHDLRLLRNDQLVGHADGKLAEASGEPFQKTFRVRLPRGAETLRFTAYAFNDDRVKSATAELAYTPPTPIMADKPRAYVITIGVNRHDNPAWNLAYAANDAHELSRTLVERLDRQARYQAIVPLILTSEAGGPNLASKADIRAVLARLAGRPADIGHIPGADKLRPAKPNDLVLISFSGHGINQGGEFYLIPRDTGPGQGMGVSRTLLQHALSAEELAHWLRDVDGGDMVMIIDACQSAASVGKEFKPGPMGARGLGQLAYEKGMRILAASQAEESALESNLTEQGLLSYALVKDGLDQRKADYRPKDQKILLSEWLGYGVQRVPHLADEVANGRFKGLAAGGGEAVVPRLSAGIQRNASLQQPALFDFTKGRRDATVVAW